MDPQLELTPNEVGFVLEKSGQDINKVLDKALLKTKLGKRHGVKRRLLGQAEVRYLCFLQVISSDLSTSARAKLYVELKKTSEKQKTIRMGPISFDIAPIDKTIKNRIKALSRLKKMIECEPELGEPVLSGTKIPVYLLAALSEGGASIRDIVQDFPSLAENQVRAALDYAQVYPKKGRPYPKHSLKRMLAALDLQSLEIERENGPPREIRV